MINLLQLIFSFMSFIIVFVGALVNWASDFLPAFILKSFRYGKFSFKGQSPFTLQVPKRWFRHFYVFSTIWSSLACYIMFSVYVGNNKNLPYYVREFLVLLRTDTGTVPASVSLLAMILLTLHCLKRFYETHFVSVFSDAKMDIGIYIVGFTHYFGAVLAILCEAPGIIFSDESYKFSFSDIGGRHIIFAACFLWASKSQLHCSKILADLRKNKEGEIITTKYKMPVGSYFDLVSCPNQFFEVLVYLFLYVILWGNKTWPFVTLWVVVNQIETALLSHWWYKETFKNYPKNRKAMIPFVL